MSMRENNTFPLNSGARKLIRAKINTYPEKRVTFQKNIIRIMSRHTWITKCGVELVPMAENLEEIMVE